MQRTMQESILQKAQEPNESQILFVGLRRDFEIIITTVNTVTTFFLHAIIIKDR